MATLPAPATIAEDATWLAQALDTGAGLVRLVRMTEQDYRAASFLDDRLFQRAVEAHIMPWTEVAEALSTKPRDDARWIFHIGHVGSTLISRLLGELPGVLSIREPRLLRDLTSLPAPRAGTAAAARAIYSRTFRPDQVAVVKATSFVSEIAAELVGGAGRALFLCASPRAYIEGILAGENSVKELHALASSRAQRMQHRVPPFLPPQASDADLAAAAWACEMTSLEAAAQAIGEPLVMWADFDAMLAGMDRALVGVTDFLGLRASPERLREINSGPLSRRYSKAMEFDYGPELRRDLLDDARRRHAPDIDKALALLHKAATSSPLLELALTRPSGR